MNALTEIIGEFPDDPDDLILTQEYALDVLNMIEDQDVLQEVIDDYTDFLLTYEMCDVYADNIPSDLDATWIPIKDGNPIAASIFKKHYSAKPNRKSNRFIGPGDRLALMTPNADALFVWRLSKYRKDNQYGAECSVFRNEGSKRSSMLILEAEKMAKIKWPFITRFYTFVDHKKIKSSNPGYCFLKAGWHRLLERSKSRNLLIFSKPVIPDGIVRPWKYPAKKLW